MWNAIFGSSEDTSPKAHEATFTLNGTTVTVGNEVSDGTSLNVYIRDIAKLSGTKYLCYEGGCGACVVAARVEHPITKIRQTFAINSCLVPVLSCHGWEITTVEGLGNKNGYHQIQATLAQFSGTQCGYCSPGMVMNMYGLSSDKTPTMAEVENAFGGNICRCTGYRPILDAFKSLASDATPELQRQCADIEDLYKICKKTGKACEGTCKKGDDFERIENGISQIHIQAPSANWYKVTTLADLFNVFTTIGTSTYKLISGNTSEGVYSSGAIGVRIDIKDIPDLRTNLTSPSLTIGGNTSLTEVISFLNTITAPTYSYVSKIAANFDKVANRPIRNIATIAGNLMMKKVHPEFPSDVFTTLESIGATLNINSNATTTVNMTLAEFLTTDMNKKVIKNIVLPARDSTYQYRVFKIAKRAQNAHAYVNAGFLVKVTDTVNWNVAAKPNLVFGGINPTFTHATNTENYLIGKNLLDAATISGAINTLSQELIPDSVLPDASPAYRKGLAQALFYKFLLGLDQTKVTPNKVSGATELIRPLSKGLQEYDTDSSLWPLNQAITKLEAIAQTAGEAEYVLDLRPNRLDEYHAIFVLTTVATGTITNVDPSAALATEGVVAYYGATDIPGQNNFAPLDIFLFVEPEEIFCSGDIKYAGQPIGIVVGKTRSAAMSGAGKVIVQYGNVRKPILTVEEVLKTTEARTKKVNTENFSKKHNDKAVVHTITGKFDIGKQYHFTMETQTCLVVPTEDGYDVISATQYMDHVQQAVAIALNIPKNKVNVTVKRLGGGYGAKISRPGLVASAVAIAAQKLNRPVRMHMTLSSNMEAMGKRLAHSHNYTVGVDANGVIQTLTSQVTSDVGCSFNETPIVELQNAFPNCYVSDYFNLNVNLIRTDTACNISCRGPGTTEGLAFIEEIMEHISKVTGIDPTQVRLNNMIQTNNPLPSMITELKTKSDYDNRYAAVVSYNNSNRWKKRGMALVPMKYHFPIWGNFSSLVSIFHGDATVAITHGGIEMGQGINTKVAQVAAHILGISIDKVSVKASASLTAPNGMTTGASIGSEAASYATMKACEELLQKLEPIKQSLVNPTWEDIIKEAYKQDVELCSKYMYTKNDMSVTYYDIWGVAAAEVEVDILTGERQILRVDILEDVGQSINPIIDIGQIEGAFVMGVGYWMTEELIHDPTTGRLLTRNTWTYKPPGAKDIPADFRIYFRKNAPNLVGVLGSKATGEPALNMSVVVMFAIRNALDSARKDTGSINYYEMKMPASVENTYLTSLTDPSQFQL